MWRLDTAQLPGAGVDGTDFPARASDDVFGECRLFPETGAQIAYDRLPFGKRKPVNGLRDGLSGMPLVAETDRDMGQVLRIDPDRDVAARPPRNRASCSFGQV